MNTVGIGPLTLAGGGNRVHPGLRQSFSLQNIHLVARWLSTLDKKVERYSSGSHEDYRVFISAEPAPTPESHIIPQGILENAIKITNEPPTGMYANLHKALDLFTQVGEGETGWSPMARLMKGLETQAQ